MKGLLKICAGGIFLVLPSCYYSYHMPKGSSDDPNLKKETMIVGDRRKVATRSALSEISPGYLLGPASYLRSSNSNIVSVHGELTDSSAFVEALSPGEVVIDYGDLSDEVTRIAVKPSNVVSTR